jgi:dTDP-4-dehydrorhamnose 3,5-epimerase
MKIKTTMIPGVVVVTPQRHADSRGYFVEAFNEREFREAGIAVTFVQDNHSFSVLQGTVRGLHFQLPPAPQSKLVRALRGSIFDVVVDLRMGSPTYGRWIAETLTAEGGEQIFVPHGLAHGFCTLEPDTEVLYKVDAFYDPECDNGIIWNDPTLAIGWPVAPEKVVLSDRDRKLRPLEHFVSPFRYELR